MTDKQNYQDWIEKFKPEAFADFDSAELPFPVKNPSNLQEAIALIKDAQIVSTGFINEMSEKGLLIKVDGKRSPAEEHVSDYHFQCSCCKKYNPDYVNHIWLVKEITALNIIQIHNYKTWHFLVESIKKELLP